MEVFTTESICDDVYIETLSTLDMVKRINDFDKTVAFSVEKALTAIAKVIDVCSEVVKNDGRIFYVGAGTSGRLGVVDASECPPTFGVSNEVIQGIMIGGDKAIRNAQENAEDNENDGVLQLKSHNFNGKDICIGISASGGAKSIIGAVDYANFLGAKSAAIICNINSELSKHTQFSIEVPVGAEVIGGSTRMKAGTATKMILNMISSCVMIKQGKVKHNRMINMRPTNIKLKIRAQKMVAEMLGIDMQKSKLMLEDYNYDLTKLFNEKLN